MIQKSQQISPTYKDYFFFKINYSDFIVKEFFASSFKAISSGNSYLVYLRFINVEKLFFVSVLSSVFKGASFHLSGIKDRISICYQYMFISAGDFSIDSIFLFMKQWTQGSVTILDYFLSNYFLGKGFHLGNNFRILMYKLSSKNYFSFFPDSIIPFLNLYGPQRFGKDNINYRKGFNILQKNSKWYSKKDHFYISSYFSFLFNKYAINRYSKTKFLLLIGDWVCPLLNGFVPDYKKKQKITPANYLFYDYKIKNNEYCIVICSDQFVDLSPFLVFQNKPFFYRQYVSYCYGLQVCDYNNQLILNFNLPRGSYATTFLNTFFNLLS